MSTHAKSRPPLLTLLASLAGLVGAATLLLTLMRLGGGARDQGVPWLDTIVALLLGSFLVVAAVGLILGRPWGRWSGTGAFGLATLLQLWEILRPALREIPVSTVALSLRGLALALLVSVLIYLNIRPAVDWFAPEAPAHPGEGPSY
jgi:hypothetical protein